MPWQFVGYPKYLQSAGEGHPPHTVAKAKSQPAVTTLAGLLSQAVSAPPENRPGILLAAREWVLALDIAHKAAVAMFGEVSAELGLSPTTDQDPEPETESHPSPARRRKG